MPYGVDDIFLDKQLNTDENIDKNLAIFTSRSDRNLDLLLNIWNNRIFPNYTNGKLLITPPNDINNIGKNNIFIRSTGDRNAMINDLCKSRVLLVPGHKAELYCLAAEEARELCIPIVTLGIGSLSERVIHNHTGFIAKDHTEFANYVLDIFKDDDLWNQFRSNLIKIRGNKNWDKSAEVLLSNV